MTYTDTVETKSILCQTQAGAPWVTNPLYEYPKSWNVWTRRGKESVDDGFFEPGVFRINPYHVESERYYLPDREVEHKYQLGSWWYWYKDSGALYAKGLSSVATSLPAFDFGNMGKRCLQKSFAKLAKNDVGMGENLGELRETISMLRHPFQSLRDFLLAADLKNLRRLKQVAQYLKTGTWYGKYALFGANAAKAAADTWLELRYGLMPLVYSVQDIIEMVEKQLPKFDSDLIRTAKSQIVDTQKSKAYYSWGYYKWQYFGEFHVEDMLRVNASVQYKLKSSMSVHELLGLSPRFIPELGWELTRLSFVVDWWLLVGQWLGAIRGAFLTPKVEVLGNTIGYRGSRNVSGTVTATLTWTGGSKKKYISDPGSYNSEVYTRSVNEHLPILPQLQLQWVDWKKSVDLVALILQPSLKALKPLLNQLK